MEAKMTTKEKIMDAALTLFSERGYDGVGVDEIAEMAGVKGPALYHYFKGKEALLQAIGEEATARYSTKFGDRQKLESYPHSMEELIQFSFAKLSFTMHDPQIKKIRKLVILEQFRNDQMKALAAKHFVFGVQELYAAIFERMMADGLLQQDDPQMMAVQFTAPITLWIHLVDREPEREEEIMQLVKKHMEHFVSVYAMPELLD